VNTFDDLLDSLAGAPRLSGAACVGEYDLFDPRDPSDPDREDIEAEAIAICHACPALFACRAWYDSLPPIKRPFGVTAGQLNAPKRSKEIA
jgi:WhiB family redox-sensing transcriptional regulator